MTTTPEQLPSQRESSPESYQSAAEQREKLDSRSETSAERTPESAERSEQKALTEALKSSVSVEAGGSEKATRARDSSPASRRGVISKTDKKASYKRTLSHVQSELTPSSRAFSKVIHAKGVEQASEVVGATIARPNAVLAGAVSAFVLTLAVYVLAKTLGYQLSGFETIAAFIAGWVIGVVYDYFRVLITGKKS